MITFLKLIAWIAFFPFMLLFIGLKKKSKILIAIGGLLSTFYIFFMITPGSDSINQSNEISEVSGGNEELSGVKSVAEKEQVDGGDLSTKNENTETEEQTNDAETIDSEIDDNNVSDLEANEDTEGIEKDNELGVDEAEETTSEESVSEVTEKESTEEEAEATEAETEVDSLAEETEPLINELFPGYALIEVDGGNLSGYRQVKVVVDIGFGDREYWAFTNEHGQLVRVVAEEIILQDELTEPVLSTGRYYPDEAKVPGVESSTLDEGHVIADSLGGVANAYNITPQDSTLNRHGDQAYMEDTIRKAGGCTEFEAIITYPDTTTQIPSHYKFTYTIKGYVVVDEFDNVNPDEVNSELNNDVNTPSEETAPEEETEPVVTEPIDAEVKVVIVEIDKKDEYVILRNDGAEVVDLTGWTILSVRGEQSFTFPSYTLQAGTTVKVGDSAKNTVDFHWLDGRGTWNNSKSDPGELYNNKGELMDYYAD